MLEQEVEELELELEATKVLKMHLEYDVQDMKNRYKSDIQAREEKCRIMAKMLSDTEAKLDEERKQKAAAVNTKKRLEVDFEDLKHTMEANNIVKEEMRELYHNKIQEFREQLNETRIKVEAKSKECNEYVVLLDEADEMCLEKL